MLLWGDRKLHNKETECFFIKLYLRYVILIGVLNDEEIWYVSHSFYGIYI
jgi:hypothetical protein